MPLVASQYQPPRHLFHTHLETILPSLVRKVPGVTYRRERLELLDGDFLDLDWCRSAQHAPRLVIVSHGLEGGSDRPYVRGMVRAFGAQGWDALAWNCRSCSGEMNRLPRLYHHADTADLAAVVAHARQQGYRQIALVGFSMGGNQTLKYLGERGAHLPPELVAAVAFSAPVDLTASVAAMYLPINTLYRRRFLAKLQRKIAAKAQQFPALIDTRGLLQIRTFREFDDRYTAPLHGFRDAADFYRQATLHDYFPAIRLPTLLVNARNDPMLPEACFPYDAARHHPYFHLETPARGGHVGFSAAGPVLWSERRACAFVEMQAGSD